MGQGNGSLGKEFVVGAGLSEFRACASMWNMDTQIQPFVVSALPGGDVGRDGGIPGNLQASLLPDVQ